jgi:hypothetical protein
MEREKQPIVRQPGKGKGATSPFPIEISKRSVKTYCKIGNASLKSHHIGYLYHIETLCEAISISLSDDNSAFLEDNGGSFYLSDMIENIFWAFEDVFLPRVVPLFFDSAFGDLDIQKTSRKCLETIVFLILYDSIFGENPGFCTVSFDCQKHGGIGYSKNVQLVVTKSSNSSHLLRQKNITSNDGNFSTICFNILCTHMHIFIEYVRCCIDMCVMCVMCVLDSFRVDRDDSATPFSSTKHMLREYASSTDAPQIILADRLAFQYLNTHVRGSGPRQNGHMSTHTWSMDISSLQTQHHDEKTPLLCDLKDNLYHWILFHDSSCSSADLHIYQSFKNTLTKLGVAFTVGDIKGGVDNQNRRKKHKICVIHERILNQLADGLLRLLISKAANVIVLVDVDVQRRDASFFGVRQFAPHLKSSATIAPSSFKKRTLPDAFCRLIRLQVYSNVTAADFINDFKEFRVEPKYVFAYEQPNEQKTSASARQHLLSKRKSENTDLVYLKAVGVTTSISSCWYQVITKKRHPLSICYFYKLYDFDIVIIIALDAERLESGSKWVSKAAANTPSVLWLCISSNDGGECTPSSGCGDNCSCRGCAGGNKDSQ